ncbi:MAG: DUF4145 domain-containing protein [Sphingobacteriaceae bacterium]|nr:DUF4145 domain-containing protein [Sphingobacteriaceae bacterium]
MKIDRCPHCYIYKPTLSQIFSAQTQADNKSNSRLWGVYKCSQCGGLVTAGANPHNNVVHEIFPVTETVNEAIPERPREYLKQAVETTFAPAGSLMLYASSVDAMLKEKGFEKGNLYSRIKLAIDSHILTEDMGEWAHKVRLEANDQRHSDYASPLPTIQDAENCIQFVKALADFLFVLPNKIHESIDKIENADPSTPDSI